MKLVPILICTAVAILGTATAAEDDDDGNEQRVCKPNNSNGVGSSNGECPSATMDNDDDDDDDDDDDECGLYLAPSTIPGAGLGVFSGSKFLNKDDWIAEPDLGVPIYDLEFHNGDEEYDNLWMDYIWQHGVYTEMKWEVFDPQNAIDTTTFGIGAAVNYLVPLVNIGDTYDTRRIMDRSGVTSASPGDGAFTPYNGRRFVSKNPIEPYSELFAYYGEEYFVEREYDDVPLSDDYSDADTFMSSYIEKFRSWAFTNPKFNNDDFQRDLWDMFLSSFENWNLRIKNALPSGEKTTIADLVALQKEGGTKRLPYNNTVKDRQWMKKNGQCMDNLRPGRSNIPHAGKGAFATRLIKKGQLVSPSPLVHIPDSKVFQLYDEATSTDPNRPPVRNASEPVHQQLMVNYCWGHNESSLLLCPYGHMTLMINHQSENPNTKIIWSNRSSHPEWRRKFIQEWHLVGHTGLSFDYVAIRDIQPGEEVTIDYGNEWQEAWEKHVEKFNESPPRPNYIPGFEWNQLREEDLPPIPTTSDPPEKQLDMVLLTIKEKYLPVGHNVQAFRIGLKSEKRYDKFFLCQVIKRQENGFYTVEVLERPDEWIYDNSRDTVKMTLTDIPRQALRFQDIPYGRSHHHYWSFRHAMMIPDEMFPDVWRNMKGVGNGG